MNGRNSRICLNLHSPFEWRKSSNHIFIYAIFTFLLGACSSTVDYRQAYEANSSASVNQLISYAKSLIGTPYRFGGSTPSEGFDCSGFVAYVFKRSAGISLPHNSNQISRHGRMLRASQLRKGDLVFYNTGSQPNSHLGIYLGNNQFIHAPSSGGKVRIENMNLTYWKKRYNGAKRISL